MLSLLIDSDEVLDEVPQTRQTRREARRASAIAASKKKPPNQQEGTPKAQSRKAREKADRREAKRRKINPEDHCKIVANAIVGAAKEIDRLPDDESKWFESRDHLINALAIGHNIVDKYRMALSVTTDYERKVINAALDLCALDNLLCIERKLGWLRLHVQDTPLYMSTKGHKLRAA